MKKNILQNVFVNRYTSQNRLPNVRARCFLTNYIRECRIARTSPQLRAALGLFRNVFARNWAREKRHAFRAVCFISGRSRGTGRRHTIARTKIREFLASTQLHGVQKASW